MKRMHIHVSVDNLKQSMNFYSALFGTQPSKQKDDYAKWMLNDPQVNFAISARGAKAGIDHLGIQVDEASELEQLREQLKHADMQTFSTGETVCCYAKSDKTWVEDPSGIAWESYQTMEDAELFSGGAVSAQDSACCVGDSMEAEQSGCC
ncbi:MAG: glyoxalase/bleomycin resistance/dioxygenase family protein [Candidatus Nitrohelix vancouverensis]|uniref:Glyoxalase/bleomycin resistance/dioxygenase family protein n=1 Tax=Candidatus Nitrohelix vancouverensis TaxID=2705534 RepID=A0A7T0G3I5_9BACT|nr:MAG: glyoxalase/bleomycin resistance/dioxygenase family protein [Candidatus Nitrohelix vancouverensis]